MRLMLRRTCLLCARSIDQNNSSLSDSPKSAMSRIIQNLQDSRQATYCPGNAFACSACFIRLFPSLVDWFNWSLPNFPAESFIHPQASFAVNFAVFGMFVVYAGVLSQGLVGICGVVLSES